MRFWITRNSEQPIREQLIRQVVLGILSEDLPAGHRLQSIRALARRHKIHSNTVSAAYQDLLRRGWVELRRGSGLYVKPLPSSGPEGSGELDALVATLLRDARKLGHDPEEVLDRLELMIRPRLYERILIVEPEKGMREILEAEVRAGTSDRVQSIAPTEIATMTDLDTCVVASLPSRAADVRARLPRNTPCITLRLNSVRKSLESHPRPPADAMHAVVSRSFEFRSSARTMLVAVGLHPDSICEIDAGVEGWRERLSAGSILVGDVVAARDAPATFAVNVFRVIAEASLAELKRFQSATD